MIHSTLWVFIVPFFFWHFSLLPAGRGALTNFPHIPVVKLYEKHTQNPEILREKIRSTSNTLLPIYNGISSTASFIGNTWRSYRRAPMRELAHIVIPPYWSKKPKIVNEQVENWMHQYKLLPKDRSLNSCSSTRFLINCKNRNNTSQNNPLIIFIRTICEDIFSQDWHISMNHFLRLFDHNNMYGTNVLHASLAKNKCNIFSHLAQSPIFTKIIQSNPLPCLWFAALANNISAAKSFIEHGTMLIPANNRYCTELQCLLHRTSIIHNIKERFPSFYYDFPAFHCDPEQAAQASTDIDIHLVELLLQQAQKQFNKSELKQYLLQENPRNGRNVFVELVSYYKNLTENNNVKSSHVHQIATKFLPAFEKAELSDLAAYYYETFSE